MTMERSESVEADSAGKTTVTEDQLSTEVDGYAISMVSKNSEYAAVLKKSGAETIEISCQVVSDSAQKSSSAATEAVN